MENVLFIQVTQLSAVQELAAVTIMATISELWGLEFTGNQQNGYILSGSEAHTLKMIDILNSVFLVYPVAFYPATQLVKYV